MLVLTRRPGERALIGDDIVGTILDARGDDIRIGIDAPRDIRIRRDEVVKAVTEADQEPHRADRRHSRSRVPHHVARALRLPLSWTHAR